MNSSHILITIFIDANVDWISNVVIRYIEIGVVEN